MRNIYIKFIILLMYLILCPTVNPAEFFTDAGSIQIGGAINYSNSGYFKKDVTRLNNISFYPIINFFPKRHLLLGPAFSWSIKFDRDFYLMGLGVGANVGFAAQSKDKKLVPFIIGAPKLILVTYNNDLSDYHDRDFGFGFDFEIGLIFPVQEHFSINVYPKFQLELYEHTQYGVFSFNIGVTGLVF